MLRSFLVANHKSIRDEHELSLVPAHGKGRRVVPVAAVFGANASGKSNLLDALRFMRSAVGASFRSWDADEGVPRSPFRLDALAAARPSTFQVDLELGGVRHVYGFSVDDRSVREEWLYSYAHRKRNVVFQRDGRKVSLGPSVPDRRGREEVLGGLLRDNALLLSTGAQTGQAEFAGMARWFGTDLVSLRDQPPLAQRIEKALSSYRGVLIDLVRDADLGIVDLRVEIRKITEDLATVQEAERVRESIRYAEERLDFADDEDARRSFVAMRADLSDRLRVLTRRRSYPEVVFLHGQGRTTMSLRDQSEGTVAWLRLVIAALQSLDQGGVLMVDEADISIHPQLIARLIELFRGPANSRGAQLVFATYDATLLGTNVGAEILRRDEIWFVEKQPDQTTKLYPLTGLRPREEGDREKRHAAGGHGAVPAVYSDTLAEVLASRWAGDAGAAT
jgi:predicted ATPase